MIACQPIVFAKAVAKTVEYGLTLNCFHSKEKFHHCVEALRMSMIDPRVHRDGDFADFSSFADFSWQPMQEFEWIHINYTLLHAVLILVGWE